MSSSRRSSRSERARCPSCGSTKIAVVTEHVVLEVGRKRHRFADVTHERCRACGERVFDLATSLRFDAVLGARRRRAA